MFSGCSRGRVGFAQAHSAVRDSFFIRNVPTSKSPSNLSPEVVVQENCHKIRSSQCQNPSLREQSRWIDFYQLEIIDRVLTKPFFEDQVYGCGLIIIFG